MTTMAKRERRSPYALIMSALLFAVALTFIFPFYWIITGSLKSTAELNAVLPVWFPRDITGEHYQRLFVEPSLKWLVNSVLMSVSSMALVCVVASMAGYVLAKKRFPGRAALFSLLVGAMALPKQVILIPLLREMSSLNLYNTIWAVIFPIVGWPFGVFLMKQFSEGIPTEMLEAARIDGASEAKTFISIVLPMVKPGIGALAIFTFINSWNDYFMQLIMLSSTSNLTISLGIAKLQAENSTDFGLIMAGAALAAVPIIIIFLIFQKYFTKGIAMGAVKG